MDVLTVGTCLVELTPGDGGLTVAEAVVLQKHASGAAALFACVLARLGAQAALLSAVGDDELGAFVIAALGKMGVDPSHILRVQGQLTPVSLASADGLGGKTFRFYRFSGYSDPLETLDSALMPDSVLSSARLFDFTESCIRNEGGLRESVFDLARRSRSLGREVCYAPNWRPVLWKGGAAGARPVQQQAVKLCDILLLNSEEAQVISGEDELPTAAESLSAMGPHTVVITCGGDEPALVYSRGEMGTVAPFEVAVRYDVGAGDTFHAGFIAAWLKGASGLEAASFAAATAALKISRPPGMDSLPTWEEAEEFRGRGQRNAAIGG